MIRGVHGRLGERRFVFTSSILDDTHAHVNVNSIVIYFVSKFFFIQYVKSGINIALEYPPPPSLYSSQSLYLCS